MFKGKSLIKRNGKASNKVFQDKDNQNQQSLHDEDKNIHVLTKLPHKLYPKNSELTIRLLIDLIGVNRTINGTLKHPIYIRKFGRLGNNIVQLSSAIYLSEVMNLTTIFIPNNFCFIKNNITTSKGIRIVPVRHTPKESVPLYHSLYMLTRGGYWPENRAYEFGNETVKSIPSVNVSKDALYIHVRSGDIFSERPNRYYGQPPLCYYESIIKKWNFKDIYILTEDTKNPVTNILVNKYNATLIITNVMETIGYILSAKNLAMSAGTFVPSLLNLVPDDPDKKIFKCGRGFGVVVDIWKKFYFTDVSPKYSKNVLMSWSNSKKQKEMMLDEKCGDMWNVVIPD